MKASEYVPLLLLGSFVAINTFSHRNDEDVRQTHYNSREDCKMDWGDAESCSYDYSSNYSGSSGGGSSSGGRYVGPRYYWDRDLGKPIEVLPNGQTRVLSNSRISSAGSSLGRGGVVGSYSRGGFGSFSRGFSSGG